MKYNSLMKMKCECGQKLAMINNGYLELFCKKCRRIKYISIANRRTEKKSGVTEDKKP